MGNKCLKNHGNAGNWSILGIFVAYRPVSGVTVDFQALFPNQEGLLGTFPPISGRKDDPALTLILDQPRSQPSLLLQEP